MARLIRSPNPSLAASLDSKTTIFLAGSIEMGKAEPWQDDLYKYLDSIFSDKELGVYDPRRDKWDASLEQVDEPGEFQTQVTWELDRIRFYSDIVCFYFDPNTTSPVTMLELGLVLGQARSPASSTLPIVCCPDGFYRKGNIDITCRELANIKVLQSKDSFYAAIVKAIKFTLR